MSKRTLRITIVTTVFLIAGGSAAFYVICSHSYQVGYHKSSMQRAWDAHFAEPDTYQDGLVGYIEGEEYERYEFHRAKLIQMDAVLELDYRFQHINRHTDESNHFTKFIMSRPLDSIDGSSPHKPGPMKWTIWCYPPDKSDWDQLMAARDIPEYKATFMK